MRPKFQMRSDSCEPGIETCTGYWSFPVGGFLFGARYDANASDVVESDLRFAADCFFHLLMGHRVWYKSS